MGSRHLNADEPMARKPKHGPAALLDLARAAIAENPNVPIAQFRDALQIGTLDAQDVLKTVRWEAGERQYAGLELGDISPKYRDLVRPRQRTDPTLTLSLDASPAELRATIDQALGATRVALGGVAEALRARAQEVVAECEALAATRIREAEASAEEIASSLDAAERITAEARAEAARVREQLRADVLRLDHELRDVTAQRDAAQITSRRAEEERAQAVAALERERDMSRLTIGELTRQISESQRIAGAAELRAATLQEALADTRRRLDEATASISRAERSLAAAEAREAALAGQLAALQAAHAAEHARLSDAHALEIRRMETRG